MEVIFVPIILSVILLLLLYIYLIWNFNYWKKCGISGPKPKPLFGNVPNCILLKRNPAYDIHDIYREYKGKERFVGIFKGRSPVLLLLDPQVIRDVLITNFKNFQDNESTCLINKETDPLYARNPFFLNREDWREKRLQIIPGLTTKKISGMHPIMMHVAHKMIAYIKENIEKNGNCFNAKEIASRFTADNMADCVYGVNANAFFDSNSPLKVLAKNLSDKYSWMQTYSTIIEFPIIKLLLKSPVMNKRIEEFFMNLSEDTMKLRENSKLERIDFLQYLIYLKNKKNLNSLDIASHCAALFLDGFETSGITITQCLNMLARHQRVQEKLRNEIMNACKDNNGEIPFEVLTELPYLDQCINETLRLFVPGKEISKICTIPHEMKTINGNLVKIDKGTSIQIPLYSLHRDEEYYTEPNEFIPERFNAENGGVKHYRDMGVFLPFGDGPRICSGMKFALTQIKVALSEIVKNFDIQLNPKSKAEIVMDRYSFLCLPQGGVWLNLNEIHNQEIYQKKT